VFRVASNNQVVCHISNIILFYLKKQFQPTTNQTNKKSDKKAHSDLFKIKEPTQEIE